MSRRGLCAWVLVGLFLNLQGCLTSAPGARGSYIPESADLRGDPKTVEKIVSAFQQFEQALQRRDLEGMMALYAEGYVDRSFRKDDLREEWQHTLAEYHGFSARHIVTRVEVQPGRTQPVALVTCSGSISAVSNATGTRVILDSWIGEVHSMIAEKGGWRIEGNATDVLTPTEVRIAGHQHQKVLGGPSGPQAPQLSNF